MGPAMRFIGLGWYVAACIVIGILGGLGLDHVAGTRLLFTLLGILFGIVAAFYGMYKLVLPLLNEPENDEEGNGRG